MTENDPEFKEKVKNSFLKVREHINGLENEIKEIKELILRQDEQIRLIKANKLDKMAEELKRSLINDQIQNVSSGNEGVQSINQSINHKTITKQIDDIKKLKETFTAFPKQRLRLYLTIYQLEDENKAATYTNLTKTLKLTHECIRAYISDILQRGPLLDKHKINNKIVVFKIPGEIKALNLKHFLEDLYYGIDSAQGRLTDL